MLSKLFGEGENKSTFPLFLERAWEVLFSHVALGILCLAAVPGPCAHPLCRPLISVVAVMDGVLQIQTHLPLRVFHLKLMYTLSFCKRSLEGQWS